MSSWKSVEIMIQTEISAIYKKPKAQGKNGYAYYLSAHVCKLVCYTLKNTEKKATKFFNPSAGEI